MSNWPATKVLQVEKLFSGKAWRLPTSNSVVNTAVVALDVARSSEQLATAYLVISKSRAAFQEQ